MDAETRYFELEKLSLALMVTSKNLGPYFHAHLIEVLTNYLLHQVIQNPKALGRLLKWAIKLGQFDVNFHPRKVIKGQALASFMVEFTYSNVAKVNGIANSAEAAKVVGVRGKKDSVLT